MRGAQHDPVLSGRQSKGQESRQVNPVPFGLHWRFVLNF